MVMKRQSQESAIQHDERRSFAVNYRWASGDGIICHGHTVAMGRNRAHAERRFFKQNGHVMPNEEES